MKSIRFDQINCMERLVIIRTLTDGRVFQANSYLEIMQEKEQKITSLVQKLEDRKMEVRPISTYFEYKSIKCEV